MAKLLPKLYFAIHYLNNNLVLVPYMRILILIISLIALAFFASQRIFNPQLNHNSVSDRLQHPFDTRLRYRIGNIDPRFNISQDQLKEITQQAADIWFLGTSTQLFTYDPNAQLTINLIYDHRQADSEARRSELSRLEDTQQSNENEFQKLGQIESDLIFQQRLIEQTKVDYQYRLDRYNNEVQKFNQSTHQNNVMRNYLQEQKQRLDVEAQQLQQQIDTFNANVQQTNQHVDTINQLNQQFNQSVAQFNQRFQARQFDKGQFNGREINIYEFQHINDLRLTLAHELGHGLGILHTEDPESLMYPILEKQDFEQFTLKAADIALLNSRN